MKKVLLLCASLLIALSVFAQERIVTGKVTAKEDGSPLPGVNVIVKGTSNGTVSDAEGRYSISIPSGATTLVFSFVGLTNNEVIVGDKSVIDVDLSSDITQLNEIVVVGYGTQERRDLTGAIASVKGSDISNLATPSFDQQLAGRAAGVNVSIPSGVLGQPPVIRIRGVNSIGSGVDPLIVVDGMPMFSGATSGAVPNNALADINPNDIESFEVLKDGSASAIYGSRAANGVILITTKKGKKGKSQVTYDAYVGVAETFKRYKVLGAEDFMTISNEKFANAGGPAAALPITIDGKVVDTDWQKLIFRNGVVQNHAVTLSGATDKTNYFFSFGWTDQKSPLVNNELKRETMRTNFNHHATDWLSFGSELGITRTQTFGLNTGSGALSGNVFNALQQFPNVPIFNPDGSYNINGASTGKGNNLQKNDFALPNLAYVLDHNLNYTTNYRVVGNGHIEAMIHRDFQLRTQLGIDGMFTDDYVYLDAGQGDGFPSGLVFQQHIPSLRWNWQNTLTYDRTFSDDHKVNIVAGIEYQKTTNSNFNATGQNLSNPYFGLHNIQSNVFLTQNIGGDYTQLGFQSLFARGNYAFKDKYLVSASIRRDAISSFANGNRTGTFPSASVGWRISSEEFFKSAGFLSSVSDLKVRASYAQVGNSDVGPFPYAALYSGVLYGSQSGLGFSAPGNVNLKWETSKKFDYGIDVGLLENKISVNADYYVNNIDGMILRSPTAPSLGIPGNFIFKNVGSMTNKGFEIGVTSQNIRTNDFSWTMNINFSTNHNKVTALDKSGDISSPYHVTRVGESIGSFYGYTYEGVNKANGNPMYQKGDGTIIQGNIDDGEYYIYNPANPTALETSASLDPLTDKKILGKSTPTYFGGFNNTFTYKGFDLQIFSRFSGGNMIMNLSRQQLLTQQFANNGTEILGRWQSASNPGDGKTPRLYLGNNDFINLTNSTSTRFLEKGDFFRIQNIVLGYSLPKATLEKIKLNKLRFYAQVQNVLLLTGYKGIDPESNSNAGSATQSGIDNAVNPQQRSFTLGVNVGF